MFEGVGLLAFDADDTLWSNEPLFRGAERKWAMEMAEYGTLEELSDILYAREAENMQALGYGAKAYLISVLETSCALAGDKLTGSRVARIIEAGREIMENPAVPYPGVDQALARIRESGRWKMVILTKGDLLDQEHKIARSGLGKYFDAPVIVSDKNEGTYMCLCRDFGVEPSELLMVGNSFKSDIAPVLSIGGWGIHVPAPVLWLHEQMEEYDHPRLARVKAFAEIPQLLGL